MGSGQYSIVGKGDRLLHQGLALCRVSPDMLLLHLPLLRRDRGIGCSDFAMEEARTQISAHALRRMLQVCSDFASEKNLIFNAGKTQLICFRSHKSVVVDERFEFCGQELTFTDTVVHLGHTLFCDLSDSEDTENKTKDFIRRANCLLANFGVCSPTVKSCLLQFFCTSLWCCPVDIGMS